MVVATAPRLRKRVVQGGDAGLAVAVALLGAVMGYLATTTQGYEAPWIAAALGFAEATPLVWRRRAPLAVLAATVIVFLVGAGLTGVAATPMIGPLVASYTVGVRCSRRAAAAAGSTVVLAAPLLGLGLLDASFPLTVSLTAEPERLTDALLGSFLGFGGATLLGAYVGTRRAYVSELAERAERLEREREARAERAVMDERARIARELHDVAAHHLSGITLQASALDRTLDRDPAEARALAHEIRRESSTALTAMRRLVDILRDDDGDGRAPQPGLGDVASLVERLRRDGADVELHLDVAVDEVPREVGLGAYRVIQESLTNVRRHTEGASATVTVRGTKDGLCVRVRDDGRGAGSPTWDARGHGLLGMRERVELLGGDFAAGPQSDGPGWCVQADVPFAGGERR